ncbi:MAG: MFS transporter [Bacillota bacterium]|nr:MFS transporter [Bacillota bacterium]
MDESLKFKKAIYHIWTFTASKLISSFGAQVYSFALSFYILRLTGSAMSFATNLICNILPRTIAAPIAGHFADKYSRKTIVIVAQIVTVMAIGGLLVVSLEFGLSLAAIYTTSCILSLTSMFSSITFTSSITGLVNKEKIQKAMSLNQMSISFASIGSPAVGGLLYGVVSMPVFLMIYMLASSIAVILESTMNFNLFAHRNNKEPEDKESLKESIKAGLNYLKMQPLLLTLISISLFINFLFGAYQVGYSFILIKKFKMTSQQFGFTEGAFAVGMLLLSFYFSVRNEVKFPFVVSKRGIIGMGFIMGAVALPLVIQMPQLIFIYYMGLSFGLGSLIITVNTPMQVMLQKQIDDDYKGRIFSILEMMAMALMPLGMLLYGYLYDVFPAQWIIILSSSLLVGSVLVLARPSVVRKIHPQINLDRNLITNKM